MGNCCGGNTSEGEVNILLGGSDFGTMPSKNLTNLFDNREVLGLRG